MGFVAIDAAEAHDLAVDEQTTTVHGESSEPHTLELIVLAELDT